jgi:hypothetical protein
MKQSILKKINYHSLERDVNAAWKFANDELWKGHSFNEEETTLSKKFIREYFLNDSDQDYSNNTGKKFFEFCARVILAGNYVKRKSGRYIPHPVTWFNPSNKFGFAGTHWWLLEYKIQHYKNIRFYNYNGTMEKRSA